MKPITGRQIHAIKKLARATKTEVNNVEKLSSFEASKVIKALIEKMKNSRQRNDVKSNDYKSDALAGLAVKILAQRCKVGDIVGSEDRFKKRAVELYRVFSSARQACLA